MDRKASVVQISGSQSVPSGNWLELWRKLANSWRSLRVWGQQCPLDMCTLPACCSCDEKCSLRKCLCGSLFAILHVWRREVLSQKERCSWIPTQLLEHRGDPWQDVLALSFVCGRAPKMPLLARCWCCSLWLRAAAQSLMCPSAHLWAPELWTRPVPPKDELQCSPGLMSGQSNCGEAPNDIAGKQGSLESGWGLINVHSSLIYAYKGLLEWSCHAGFDNANSIHPASCCSVVAVCVAACRIMVLLWECYVPWIEPHRAICFILTNPSK